MTDDTLRAALDVGIYPAATPDGPRTPWQDGWNAGVMAVAEAVEAALATQPAGLDAERTAREHFEPRRHFFEPPDGDVCSDCGEARDADFVRITVHFNDGDG